MVSVSNLSVVCSGVVKWRWLWLVVFWISHTGSSSDQILIPKLLKSIATDKHLSTVQLILCLPNSTLEDHILFKYIQRDFVEYCADCQLSILKLALDPGTISRSLEQLLSLNVSSGDRVFYIFIVNDISDLSMHLQLIDNLESSVQYDPAPKPRKAVPPIYGLFLSQNFIAPHFTISRDHHSFIPEWQNILQQIVRNQVVGGFRHSRSFHVNSNVYILSPSASESSDITATAGTTGNSWTLFELYALNETVWQLNTMSSLSQVGGNKVESRSNFHKIIVRATAPEGNMTQGELIWAKDVHTGRETLVGGFGVDIFKCFQHTLNFETISVPTKGWAKLVAGSKNTWDVGMAKEIADGNADIGLAKTSIFPYRAASLSYLVPVHALILTVFFRQPSISSVRNILYLPFTWNLWFGFIVTWILIICSMRFIAYLTNKLTKARASGEEEVDDEHEDVSYWTECNFWCFGAICQQGWHMTPNTGPLRIVLYLGLFLGLIGYVAYSATLVSIFSTATVSINSFEELLQSSMKITIDTDNVVAITLTTKSSSDLRNQIYSNTANLLIKKVSSGGNSSFLKAIDGQAKLLSDSYAYLTFTDKFYITIKSAFGKDDQFLCGQVSSFPVTSVPFRSGLFVAKGSPYKEFFNAKILIIFTSGLMKRYVKDYESAYTPICSDERNNDSGDKSLEIADLFSAHLLIICGLMLSPGIFALEWLTCQVKVRKAKWSPPTPTYFGFAER